MTMPLTTRPAYRTLAVSVLLILASLGDGFAKAKISHDPQKTRDEYVARIQQQTSAPPTEASLGSLWTSGGAMTNLQADYKASRVNGLVTIVVVQRTTAQATGNVS